MNLIHVLGALAITALLSIAVTHVVIQQEYEYEVEYTITVADSIGIDLETDKLRFGQAIPGSTAKRAISYTKNSTLIRVTGDLSEYVVPQGLHTIHNQSIEFSLSVPPDTEHGTYSGTIYLT